MPATNTIPLLSGRCSSCFQQLLETAFIVIVSAVVKSGLFLCVLHFLTDQLNTNDSVHAHLRYREMSSRLAFNSLWMVANNVGTMDGLFVSSIVCYKALQRAVRERWVLSRLPPQASKLNDVSHLMEFCRKKNDLEWWSLSHLVLRYRLTETSLRHFWNVETSRKLENFPSTILSDVFVDIVLKLRWSKKTYKIHSWFK